MSNQRQDVKRWMRMQQQVSKFETATELAELTFAEYPEVDESVVFELAHEIVYEHGPWFQKAGAL